MAIYKPSNCVPFMDSWDLREAHNLQFELNTNNTVCVGYKINLLDSKNNVIYQGEDFTKFKTPQYNGNVIEIPFIVIGAPAEVTDFQDNTIYYVAATETETEKWVCKNNNKVVEVANLFNGYQNQPYKWVVSLTQGNTQRDYDMTLSSGYIAGSTPTRIQSELSEYIYKDNYIQLVDKVGKDIGSRVLIDSYDHTYGYIYPVEGGFTQEAIDKATSFKIYKGSNDPEVISTSRIVKAATTKEITDWQPDTNYPYYFRSTVGKTGTIDGITIAVGDTILVKDQTNNTPYNGVFTLQSKAGDSASSEMVWSRATVANTWAKIINNTFYVANGTSSAGKIFEANNGVDKTVLGTINETPISITKENPVEIYPLKEGDDDKTIGKIFKTNEISYDTFNVVAGTDDGIKMSDVYLYGNKNSAEWAPNEDGDFKQIFSGTNEIPTGYITYGGLLSAALGGYQGTNYGSSYSYITKGGSILVKNEENQKYNGVFTLQEIETETGTTSTKYSSVTLIWRRNSFNDKWDEFARTIFVTPIYNSSYLTNPQTVKNYCVTTYEGIFDETNITFEESANGLPKYYYKNVYVRPFIGLESGMKFEYDHENVTGEIQYIYLDSKKWCVKYIYEQNGINPPDFIPDVDTYKISSNFKTSDENPFYAFDTPEIEIVINNSYGTGSGDEYSDPILISSRVINAVANYDQTNNKQWINYQWTLINSSLNDYRQTDITYTGKIQCNFTGVEKSTGSSNKYVYQLILTIEDELGNKILRTKYIKIGDDVEVTTNPFEKNIEQKFNCDLHNFEVAFGVINDVIPENDDDEILYEKSVMSIPDEVDAVKNTTNNIETYAAQIYDQTEVGSGTGFYSSLPIPQSDDFTLNSQHSNLSQYFEGEILRYDMFVDNDKTPKSVVITTNTDTKTDENGIVIENEKRNLVTISYNNLSKNYKWRETKPVIYSMQDSEYVIDDSLYDYINTEKAYVYETSDVSGEPLSGYLNLKEYNSRKEGYTGSPFVSWTPTEGDESFGVLSKETIEQKYQADKTLISVLKQGSDVNINTLPTQTEAAKLTWQDKGHGVFFMTDVNAINNHSGRQDFKNQDFGFNIVVTNYKKEDTELTVGMFQNNVKKDPEN